jgi:hypothetical protein
LKRLAVAFAQALTMPVDATSEAETSAEQQGNAVLEAVTGPGEEMLAAALPLVEYGDAVDHAAIAQALQHVVDSATTEDRSRGVAQASAVVAVARVMWALATYGLAVRRIDVLTALAGVGTLTHDDEQPTLAIVDDRRYRYPDALGGNAGHSYRDYYDWLAARGLVGERLPYLASTLDATFGEADVLLALRMQTRFPGRTYSGGMRNVIIRRLALRFRDIAQRKHLGQFLGVDDAALDEHVDGAYVQLEHDRNYMALDLPARMLGTASRST